MAINCTKTSVSFDFYFVDKLLSSGFDIKSSHVELLRDLAKNQSGKDNAENMKKMLKEIEDLDEMIYQDIKKTKVSEPVQIIQNTQVS